MSSSAKTNSAPNPLVYSSSLPLGATGIGGNKDSLSVRRDQLPKTLDHQGRAGKVVERNVKEALELFVMQIHGNHMVCT